VISQCKVNDQRFEPSYPIISRSRSAHRSNAARFSSSFIKLFAQILQGTFNLRDQWCRFCELTFAYRAMIRAMFSGLN